MKDGDERGNLIYLKPSDFGGHFLIKRGIFKFNLGTGVRKGKVPEWDYLGNRSK